jgi:SulP family sulfate permease
MTGRRHRSNMELIAQGVANIASPLFGGIPATGAIARTATNIKSGGRTPVSGIVHALTLLLIMLVFGQWAALIPLPVLAAILMSVALKMGEWRLMLHIFKSTNSDVLVMLSTFALTVFIDLTVAIEVGIVMAALLFMKRMADVSTSTPDVVHEIIEPHEEESAVTRPVDAKAVPERVEVFEVAGPFFFAAVDKFKNAIQRIEQRPRVLILRMRAVPAIDATGLIALEEVFDRTHAEGGILLLSGLQDQPREVLFRSGLMQKIGEQNFPEHIELALARAREVLKERER